jgi:hypothetical protein
VNFIHAAVRQVVGLFVGDWLQSVIVLVIVAAGWFAISRFGAPALILMVALLAGQLVWFARAEGRPSRSGPPHLWGGGAEGAGGAGISPSSSPR